MLYSRKIFGSLLWLLLVMPNAKAELDCLPADESPSCPGGMSFNYVCSKPCSGGFEHQFSRDVYRAGEKCRPGMTQSGTCFGGYYDRGPQTPSADSPNSPPDCNYVEPTAAYIRQTMQQENGKRTSMTDFLKKLPASMRSNFIFMGKSDSLQTSSAENPRVIMTSERGDVRVTFNTNPNDRGYNKVEVSMWNPEKQGFDYMEMDFTNSSGRAENHTNPTSCTQCHGEPTKPNWDNYNFWAGAIPMNKDTLVPGTQEADMYLNLIRKAERARNNDPLSALILDRPNRPDDEGDRDSRKLERRLKRGEKIQLNPRANDGSTFSGTAGGTGVMMFDRMVARAGCSAQREIKDQIPKPQMFNALKYILSGLEQGCDMDGFVPDWYTDLARLQFSDIDDLGEGARDTQPINPTTASERLQRDVYVDTDIRQKRVVLDKIGRQLYFLEQSFLQSGRATNQAQASQMARAEMEANRAAIGLNIAGQAPGRGNPINPYYDRSGSGAASDRFRFQNGDDINTLGESTSEVSRYRYFLEPFGIQMNRWSGSIDETSYSFSDIFSSLKSRLLSSVDRQNISRELGSNNNCEGLAARSLAALSGNRNMQRSLEQAAEARCESFESTVNNPVDVLTGVSRDMVERQAFDIFNQTCVMCHTAESGKAFTSDGPPAIPFNNMTQLKQRLARMPGSPTNLGFKIWERVQRHPGSIGAMPRNMGSLSRDELSVIRTFLENEGVFTNP